MMKPLVLAILGFPIVMSSALPEQDPRIPATLAPPKKPAAPVNSLPPRRAGLYVDEATCANNLEMVYDSLYDLNMFATAGLNAVSKPFTKLVPIEKWDYPYHPTSYFFDPQVFDKVQAVFQDAINYAGPRTHAFPNKPGVGGGFDRGDPIRITCLDQDSVCNGLDPGSRGPLAYHSRSSNDDAIVLCPRFARLSPWQAPCSGRLSYDGQTGMGATTRGQYLLYMFIKIHNKIDGQALGTRECHSVHASSPVAPLSHPGCFARFANWAFDLGVMDFKLTVGPDGTLWPPELSCLSYFRLAVTLVDSPVGEWPKSPDLALPTALIA